MMRRANYERELQDIFDKLVLMCRSIERAIVNAVNALVERKFALADEVYEADKLVDKLEREIEQACLRIIVMEQPMASDFRDVSAALKMITDLERIGDQAWDVMEITLQFEEDPFESSLECIQQMSVIVIQMVKDGVRAYINRDLELAKTIDETDDKVDRLFEQATAEIIAEIKEDPNRAAHAVRLLLIAKYFERIGDHAVNVGEWVEYSITGNHPKNIDL